MRISDWSSDVCSSDLAELDAKRDARLEERFKKLDKDGNGQISLAEMKASQQDRMDKRQDRMAKRDARSEEHTSELQSLMRISYAVFCLKKKKATIDNLPLLCNVHYITTHRQTNHETRREIQQD